MPVHRQADQGAIVSVYMAINCYGPLADRPEGAWAGSRSRVGKGCATNQLPSIALLTTTKHHDVSNRHGSPEDLIACASLKGNWVDDRSSRLEPSALFVTSLVT